MLGDVRRDDGRRWLPAGALLLLGCASSVTSSSHDDAAADARAPAVDAWAPPDVPPTPDVIPDLPPPRDIGVDAVDAAVALGPCPAPRIDPWTPPAPGPSCRARTCDSFSLACGAVSDGCGGALSCGPCAAPAVRVLDLGLRDIAWDASRALLYGSVASSDGAMGDRVVAIDPATATVVRSWSVGGDPDPLSLSADASRLYVGLDAAAAVRVIDLRSGALEPAFALGPSDLRDGSLRAMDLAVLPDDPRAVAVVRASTGSTYVQGVSIFDDGVLRPVSTLLGSSTPVHAIAFVRPGLLVGANSRDTGANFAVLSVCPSGVSLASGTVFALQTFRHEMQVSEGLAFHGELALDPATGARVGRYPVVTDDLSEIAYAVVPDATTRRTYFVASRSSGAGDSSLIAFDRDGFARLDAVALPDAIGVPFAGTRCGPGCVAVLAGGGFGVARRLVVIETPLVAQLRAP